VTLEEIVAAYAAIGNQGVYVKPYLISRVESADGELLEENRGQRHEALDPRSPM